MIFLDLETTGLNPASDLILEVACMQVDPQLNPVRGFSAVIHRTGLVMDAFVRDMHTKNGLIAACEASTTGLVEVTDALCEWLPPGKSILAGSSVYFDLGFLKASMPRVADRFGHRLFDVSAIDVGRRWTGLPDCDIHHGAHRAESDVLASIAKARWHMSRVVP